MKIGTDDLQVAVGQRTRQALYLRAKLSGRLPISQWTEAERALLLEAPLGGLGQLISLLCCQSGVKIVCD